MALFRRRKSPYNLKLIIPEPRILTKDWRLSKHRLTSTKKWTYSQEKVYRAKYASSVFKYPIDICKRSTALSPVLHPNLISNGGGHLANSSSPQAGTTGHALTPTDQLLDDPLLQLLADGRRSSSGALLSPEVLDQIRGNGGVLATSGIIPEDAHDGDDNFYLLKKDSQRRLTLVRVLKHDRIVICQQWHQLLMKDVSDLCLTHTHLHTLMDGLRSYILDQNKVALDSALAKLKEELDFDVAINQISHALYVFQDAVNLTLRSHSIKPHWMFALDNLVRNAVQAAITILSPEFGAHLAASDDLEDFMEAPPPPPPLVQAIQDRDASTSGVSTDRVSVGLDEAGLPVMLHYPHEMQVNREPNPQNDYHLQQVKYAQLNQLREENSRLLSQLVTMQQNYQELLRQNLADQRVRLQLSAANKTELKEAAPAAATTADHEMVTWLRNLSLNDDAVQKFVDEDLTLTDITSLMTRDDLRRLGLKTGPELRVWKSILALREDNTASKVKNIRKPPGRKKITEKTDI